MKITTINFSEEFKNKREIVKSEYEKFYLNHFPIDSINRIKLYNGTVAYGRIINYYWSRGCGLMLNIVSIKTGKHYFLPVSNIVAKCEIIED